MCIHAVRVYCWVGVTRQDSIMVLGDEAVIKKEPSNEGTAETHIQSSSLM